MQVPKHPRIHLSYCTNVHPGESWRENYHQLKTYLPELKKRLHPDQSFGIGLRLSAVAANELLDPDKLDDFKSWLSDEDLYVFTVNGFPYGSFHRERVKDEVYKPDWRTPERYNYTSNLINLLAELLPDGVDGSISTSPVSYKYWNETPDVQQQTIRKSCIHLAKLAGQMASIYRNKGKEIHLAIEPEPDCTIENSRETLHFFLNDLIPKGGKHLASELQLSQETAEEMIRRHIGICYDTCHFALQYENPAVAISAFRDAGIRIGKTQISAALKIPLESSASDRLAIAQQLQQFVEPVYLHQVIERHRDGSVHPYRDLSDALRHIHQTKAEEWRVHFHVPVFHREFSGLYSTQDEITESLKILFDPEICNHFEIETYTWEVLPDELKANLPDSLEREFRWTLDTIEQIT